MFSTLIKRKLTDNQVANIFINALYDSIDNGFSEVAQLINEDLAFPRSIIFQKLRLHLTLSLLPLQNKTVRFYNKRLKINSICNISHVLQNLIFTFLNREIIFAFMIN